MSKNRDSLILWSYLIMILSAIAFFFGYAFVDLDGGVSANPYGLKPIVIPGSIGLITFIIMLIADGYEQEEDRVMASKKAKQTIKSKNSNSGILLAMLCGNCEKDISKKSKIGDTCPHCHVTWGYEKETIVYYDYWCQNCKQEITKAESHNKTCPHCFVRWANRL